MPTGELPTGEKNEPELAGTQSDRSWVLTPGRAPVKMETPGPSESYRHGDVRKNALSIIGARH